MANVSYTIGRYRLYHFVVAFFPMLFATYSLHSETEEGTHAGESTGGSASTVRKPEWDNQNLWRVTSSSDRQMADSEADNQS